MKAKHGLVLLSALSAGVLAAPPMAPTRYPHRSEQAITHLCGGIGETESTRLKQTASNYDAMLVFARSDGAYLADVNVEIRDARGRPILNERCDGPIMLFNVPRPGIYQIRAEFDGYAKNRTLHIRNNAPARLLFILSSFGDAATGGQVSEAAPLAAQRIEG